MTPMVEYENGAKRDNALPYYRLLEPAFLEEIAVAMTTGALKKGEYNWKNGGEEFAKACYDHAFKHLIDANQASTAVEAREHLGHCAANLMFLHEFAERGLWVKGYKTLEELAVASEMPTEAATGYKGAWEEFLTKMGFKAKTNG